MGKGLRRGTCEMKWMMRWWVKSGGQSDVSGAWMKEENGEEGKEGEIACQRVR